MINPALVQLAKDFDISVVRASYQTTVCIALNGVAPWIWIPFAHKFGRRPIWLFTTLLAFVSILGCAYAKTYSQLLVARVFNGLFPVGFALGATTVTDLFPFHQRGRAMGFFTVTVVNGSHLSPIIGGLLGQYCGWRWIFKFLAIIDATLLVVAFFCLPETLFVSRGELPHANQQHKSRTPSQATLLRDNIASSPSSFNPFTRANYLKHLRLISHNPTYQIRASDFVIPTLKMARYPSVLFPAIYFATMYGFASIVPAVTVASIFSRFYHWNTLTIGLTFGASLTIGGILGELCTGWIIDRLIKRASPKPNSDLPPSSTSLSSSSSTPSPPSITPNPQRPPPELRLRPIWPGELLTTAGLLIYGFTIHYRTAWIAPIFAMGLSCFGLQIITTTMYTYSIDCHRAQSAEVAQLFNFIRQMFGMTYAFYVVRLGDRIGYQWTFVFFAVCGGVLAFLPILVLMFKGSRWRRRVDERIDGKKKGKSVNNGNTSGAARTLNEGSSRGR